MHDVRQCVTKGGKKEKRYNKYVCESWVVKWLIWYSPLSTSSCNNTGHFTKPYLCSASDICEPSFDISEILVLGCGRNIEPINPEIRRFIRSTGMKLEAVDSVSKVVASPHFLVCCALAAYVVNKFAKEWHHNNSDGSNSNNNSWCS